MGKCVLITIFYDIFELFVIKLQNENCGIRALSGNREHFCLKFVKDETKLPEANCRFQNSTKNKLTFPRFMREGFGKFETMCENLYSCYGVK